MPVEKNRSLYSALPVLFGIFVFFCNKPLVIADAAKATEVEMKFICDQKLTAGEVPSKILACQDLWLYWFSIKNVTPKQFFDNTIRCDTNLNKKSRIDLTRRQDCIEKTLGLSRIGSYKNFYQWISRAQFSDKKFITETIKKFCPKKKTECKKYLLLTLSDLLAFAKRQDKNLSKKVPTPCLHFAKGQKALNTCLTKYFN